MPQYPLVVSLSVRCAFVFAAIANLLALPSKAYAPFKVRKNVVTAPGLHDCVCASQGEKQCVILVLSEQRMKACLVVSLAVSGYLLKTWPRLDVSRTDS